MSDDPRFPIGAPPMMDPRDKRALFPFHNRVDRIGIIRNLSTPGGRTMTATEREPRGLQREVVRRTLGRNLSALRRRRKWSQEKLARKLGVTRGRLSKWETGEHSPPLEMLPALATALEAGVEEIVEGIAGNQVSRRQ
jgi:DNA-binding XRE family transcriptional regulator